MHYIAHENQDQGKFNTLPAYKNRCGTLFERWLFTRANGFGNGILTYALKVYGSNQLSASFEDNKITLFMPEAMAESWATTDKEGFEETTDPLYLLIEKDFQCLDNVIEDQSDNYPNPLLSC
ncbi:MAG: hypothetical protein JWR38_4627 [Mucilaginibacter sp.]|nr:hypothetical protein [Mucilaginibacter sp.]